MGRFLVGLIIGAIVGVLAVGYNPEWADRLHEALTDATAAVMRGTEEAAETVGEAANEAADEAEQAAGDREAEAERTTGEPAEEVEREAQGSDEPPAADPQ